MIGQPNFNAKGPAEFSGSIFSSSSGNLGSSSKMFSNLYLTGTGYMDKLTSRETYSLTGYSQQQSIEQLYPIGQPNLGHANQRWANLYATGTGYFDKVDSRQISTQTVTSTSEICESGVFNYLGPTGRFFPPQMTQLQRTGLWSGYATTGLSSYDGIMVFQIPDQNFYVVRSGQWKVINLS